MESVKGRLLHVVVEPETLLCCSCSPMRCDDAIRVLVLYIPEHVLRSTCRMHSKCLKKSPVEKMAPRPPAPHPDERPAGGDPTSSKHDACPSLRSSSGTDLLVAPNGGDSDGDDDVRRAHPMSGGAAGRRRGGATARGRGGGGAGGEREECSMEGPRFDRQSVPSKPGFLVFQR